MSGPSWALAIDFGTSFTAAAVVIEGSRPEAIEIDGERRVPSMFHVDDAGRLLVGRVAQDLSSSNPANTLRTPKSRLGDQTPIILGGRTWSIVDMVEQLLAAVARSAIEQMGSDPGEVVLTHPATWNHPQVNRLRDAAVQAHLPRPKMVAEPVAAGWSYAADVGLERGAHLAIYDLGGGTFDTAVVRATDDGIEIIGRATGDATIGGELFDELMVNHLGAQLEPALWEAIQLGLDAPLKLVGATIRHEARRIKEMLSVHEFAEVLLPLPMGMQHLRVSRDELEQMISPYVEETVVLLRRCIVDAGIAPADLEAIYMVGGASRTPIAQRLVATAFPTVGTSRRGDPKTAVVLGALRADNLGTGGAPSDVARLERALIGGSPSGHGSVFGRGVAPAWGTGSSDSGLRVASGSGDVASTPPAAGGDVHGRGGSSPDQPQAPRPVPPIWVSPHSTNPPVVIPAQWTSDPTERHEKRYWDGQAWTQRVVSGSSETTDAMPTQTGPAFPNSAPSQGWHRDPAGRHQLRYWDGTSWTSAVADDGSMSTDDLYAPGWVLDPAGRHARRYWDGAMWTRHVDDEGATGDDDISPPGWHPDPTGRHQSRYWNGVRWTEHVSDAGQMSTSEISSVEASTTFPR